MSNSPVYSSDGNYSDEEFDTEFADIVLDRLGDVDPDAGRECPDCHGWGTEDKWDDEAPPCFTCGGEGYL